MTQSTCLVLVKVPEHHRELLESIFRHSRLVSSLNLLFKIVLDPHAKLVKLIPLLSKANSGVLSVPVVQDQVFFQKSTQVFNLFQVRSKGSHLMCLDANSGQLLFQCSMSLHHCWSGFSQPAMESIGIPGILLSQVVILLLPDCLLSKLSFALLDDLLQISPGLFQCFHCEPGVWIRSNIKALDLSIQLLQWLKIFISCCKWGLELSMGFTEGADFLNGVATYRISHVFLSILKPGVEGRRFLGKCQIEFFNLPELILNLLKLHLSVIGISKKLVPAVDDVIILPVDGLTLVVAGCNQLILEGSYVLNALILKCIQTNVKCLLLGQECLYTWQIFSKIINFDIALFVSNPGFNHISFPHELEVGRVV